MSLAVVPPLIPIASPPILRLSGKSNSRHRQPPCAAASAKLGTPEKAKAVAAILDSGVIACLRADDAETAMEAALAALRGGISVLELVASTPGAFEVVEELRRSYPQQTFGVGTVLNIEHARKAVRAGVHFIMSPATVMEVLTDQECNQVLYIPGVMTPTEILTASSAGAEVLKVYPVKILGGPKYISALKRPFSYLPLVASQGITTGSIREYLEAGASAVVLSDAIFQRGAMNSRNFSEVTRLAAIAMSEVAQSKK